MKKAVAWAVENKIIFGVSDDEFAPDKLITREQIAAIFYRYAAFKKCDVSAGENTDITRFSDYESIEEYAAKPVKWATGSGLMKGKDGGALDPKGNTTKAETAALLVRMIDEVIG